MSVRGAPLRRRAAASAIDILLLLPVIGALAWGYIAYVQRRDPENGRARRPDPSRRWQVLISVAATATLVVRRNRRGPGYRILRLRRVDARTLGPVSLRSALIRETLRVGLRYLTSRLQPRVNKDGQRSAGSAACGRAVLIFGALEAPALWPPTHQSLPDRLAGIVVIVED